MGNIAPLSSEYIEMTVYIPETLSGQTLRLPLQISYIDAHGESVSEMRTVDFYVRGLVDLSVYGVETFFISDTTMVVGEIINEGNEDALFAFVTIEPAGTSNIAAQTQFIDEIDTDSPVPFNVPLEFDGSPLYGEHDIVVTVRYKDDIREEHFLVHPATISVAAPEQAGEESVIPGLDAEAPSSDTIVMLAAGAVAIIIVAVLVAIRRRR